jgi:hypothetical protein
LLIFNLATSPAAAYIRSHVSFLAPNGVVGGDNTPFGLPLPETDQLLSPLSVDSGDPAMTHFFHHVRTMVTPLEKTIPKQKRDESKTRGCFKEGVKKGELYLGFDSELLSKTPS